MAVVTNEYLSGLAPIYQSILKTLGTFDKTRKAGYGLAYGTLFEVLRNEPYSPGEIMDACRMMEQGGAVKIKNGGFVCPTDLGEDIIAALLGGRRAPSAGPVPPFSPPPST